MKNMLVAKNGDQTRSFAIGKVALLTVGVILADVFWMISAPIAGAEKLSPTQMIESQLPRERNMTTAKKPELLSAVCGSVRRWQSMSGEIVTTAAASHSKWTISIVQESIRCLGNDDCEMIARVTSVGISANPDEASDILDMAVAAAPDCRGALDQLFSPPAEGPDALNNLPNPPNFVSDAGGAGVDPQESTVTVCDNNAPIQVAASRVTAYLASHPGSFAGACQPTPVTNK